MLDAEREQYEQMLGQAVPPELEEAHDRFKSRKDRLRGGPLSPEVMTMLAFTVCPYIFGEQSEEEPEMVGATAKRPGTKKRKGTQYVKPEDAPV